MSGQPHDPALTRVEAALAALAPQPASLDRDRLMFQAGQAAAARRPFWPLATAAALVIAAFQGAIALRPVPANEHVVYVRVSEPTQTLVASAPGASSAIERFCVPPSPEGLSYLALRNQVLLAGLNALPAVQPLTGEAPHAPKRTNLSDPSAEAPGGFPFPKLFPSFGGRS